ncbi:MAG: 2-phosphosulfolactate phosphatase [Bacteroidota bacterium]
MKVNVLLSPNNVDELYFTGKTTVVIDVLRATSVIVEALNNGAKEVIPVGSIDFAMKISINAHGGQTLLCGERNTKKIDGFDLGNSPQEFVKEVVHGKSVVLFTTNGSGAIVKAKYSGNLVIASFNNLTAIAEHLLNSNEDIEIIAAGANGMFCIEDTICAGALIQTMQSLNSDFEVTDAGKASLVLNEQFGSDVLTMLKESEHGKKLIENEFEDDLSFCSVKDNIPIIPFYKGGEIKLLNKN